MLDNNICKRTKIISIILLFLYLIYYSLIISWIKFMHSEINIYSVVGIFVPFILFLLITYGLFKTSGLISKKHITINLILIILPVLISFGLVVYNEAESKFNYEKWFHWIAAHCKTKNRNEYTVDSLYSLDPCFSSFFTDYGIALISTSRNL